MDNVSTSSNENNVLFSFFPLYLPRSLQIFINSRTVSAHLISETTWNNQEINKSTFPHSPNHIRPITFAQSHSPLPSPSPVLKFHNNEVIIQFQNYSARLCVAAQQTFTFDSFV